MKKTFQLSVIAMAMIASNTFAAQVVEGPTGSGTGGNNVSGTDTIAVGQGNVVDNNSTSIGYFNRATGQNSFVAGSRNNTNDTNNSVAMGGWNFQDTHGDNSIAVGADVVTDKLGSIAVGNSIHVYGENATSVGGHNQVAGNQATSFGDWAWTGNDAATAIGSQTYANAKNATTLGYNAETAGENALRIGAQSSGSGLNSIVIGSHATATTEDSIQLGSGGAGAAGIPGTSIADDKNSVAIGYGSDTQGQGASSENTVSVGGALGGAIRRITQVTDGVDDKDAINMSQLNDAIAGLTSGAELITIADGLLTTEKEQRIAADTGAINAIAAEATARAAGDDAEKAARISAVNAEAQARIAGDAAEAAARADADLALNHRIDVEAATRTSEVNRLDGRIDQASRRLDDIEKSAYRGVAIALAAQQAVPNIRSGQIALFAGVGHYEGETAGSVGVVTSFIANRVSLSGAVGFAGGNEVGGRIGLSYSF